MTKKILSLTAIAIMAGSAYSADYNFPSAGIPGGYAKDEVKQIVSYIWDDNSYSGLLATDYETEPGQPYDKHSWVGGKKPWGADADNKANIQPGDMGMSWAIASLAGTPLPPTKYAEGGTYTTGNQVLYNGHIWEAKYYTTAAPGSDGEWGSWTDKGPYEQQFTKTNPDGSPIHFSFNVISGLFVPVVGSDWKTRVTKYGYWVPTATDVKEFPHLDGVPKVAACWGREMPVWATDSAGKNVNGEMYGQINNAFDMTKELGHEIGNHTIDHLETNSPLPNDDRGFGKWGGEGFAPNQTHEIHWSNGAYDTTFTYDEAEEFGRTPGITWHKMGWEGYAGKSLSTNAWKGLIELGESEIKDWLGLSAGNGIYGFRAPRLEVSSGLFWGLKEAGYQYDCGNEEGYEQNRDGTNFVWPYTTDNGNPNFWTQKEMGEFVTVDSMPEGLWEYPVNAMVVPEDIRAQVYHRHKVIANAEGEDTTQMDVSEWDGKVTGFDFNMFILFGMTKDDALATLKHTLDLRMAGNKAPMHVGCHTDYFTIIYDQATLLESHNRPTYGMVVDSGWNTWKDRKATWEGFRDYALDKGAYFMDAHSTIEYVKDLVNNPKVAIPAATKTVSGTWALDGQDVSAPATISDLNNISVNFNGTEDQFATYTLDLDEPVQVSHIEIPNYKISSAVRVGLVFEDGKEVQALLNNLKMNAHSGVIPVYQMEVNPYETEYSTKDVDMSQKVTAITINVYTPGAPEGQNMKATSETASLDDIKLYLGDPTGINENSVKATKSNIAIGAIKNGNLQLNLHKAGNYSVNVYTIGGRLVKSINKSNMVAGNNSVNIGTMPAGMYLVRVNGNGLNVTSKAVVR